MRHDIPGEEHAHTANAIPDVPWVCRMECLTSSCQDDLPASWGKQMICMLVIALGVQPGGRPAQPCNPPWNGDSHLACV